jgi:hypothetical protein
VSDAVNSRGVADPLVLDLSAGQHTVSFQVREDGASLDTIRLVAVPVSPPPPTVCSSGVVEAESGVLSGSVVSSSLAGASGGVVVGAAQGSGSDLSSAGTPVGSVAVCFDVAVAGQYTVSVVESSPDGDSDSWWVSVDGGPAALWDARQSGGSLVSDAVNSRGVADPLVLDLSAGQHTVSFQVREDGASLDTIQLTPAGP